MTRGNQRNDDRLKAQKKQGKNKGTQLENGETLAHRMESTAEIMRQKQLRANEVKK